MGTNLVYSQSCCCIAKVFVCVCVSQVSWQAKTYQFSMMYRKQKKRKWNRSWCIWQINTWHCHWHCHTNTQTHECVKQPSCNLWHTKQEDVALVRPSQIKLPLNLRKCVSAVNLIQEKRQSEVHCLLCVIDTGAYTVSPDPDCKYSSLWCVIVGLFILPQCYIRERHLLYKVDSK